MKQKLTIFISMTLYSVVLVMIGLGSDTVTLSSEPESVTGIYENIDEELTYIPEQLYQDNTGSNTVEEQNIGISGENVLNTTSGGESGSGVGSGGLEFSGGAEGSGSISNSGETIFDIGAKMEYANTGDIIHNTASGDNGFGGHYITGTESSGITKTSTGEISGGLVDPDQALAVLYIPEQTPLEETNSIAPKTDPNIEFREGNGGGGDSTGGDSTGGGGDTGAISIQIADIIYSGNNLQYNGKCFGLQYCLIVEDNNGSLGWYISIDQGNMISNTAELDDAELYINSSDSPLVTLRGGSLDARVISTNGNVNFDNDAGHTILSKQRIDGIVGTYATNPIFSANINQLPSGLYTGKTVITLYYY